MSEINIIVLPRPTNEEINIEAYHRYIARTAEGRPGDEHTDWEEARDLLFSSCQSETSIDPELGKIFNSLPDFIDNLAAIKGLGPVSVKRLHELGVYRFEQIASWTPEITAAFGARLGLKNRIEKGNWVGQAQALASTAQVA